MQALQTTSLVTCSLQRPSVPTANRMHLRSPSFLRINKPFAAGKSTPLVRQRNVFTICAAEAQVDTKEHLQLATARLPKGVDVLGFSDSLYQWAATLTSSGRNMPFALPIRADKLKNGFQVNSQCLVS